jgi:dethiobiotin synthetase
MKFKSIYVAATSQHVGKTTSTLGLVSAFRNMGVNVGYCKPVGQRFVMHNGMQVDKDVVLFSDLLGFKIDPSSHSPVILGPGATTDYIDNPAAYDYEDSLQKARLSLQSAHDLVIYEGTGHPGVGSVVGLSNADVAQRMQSGLIMVAEGGIGSTIDMISLCLEKFYRCQVPIIGVILNKVLDEKRPKIEKYVSKWLEQYDIPFLGSMPFDKTMSFPMFRTIVESVKGKIEFNADQVNNNMVENIVAGSLISTEELVGSGENNLLVVGATRLGLAIEDISSIMKSQDWEKPPFSGIISTGHGDYSKQTIEFVQKHKIPLVRTMLETYGAVVKIARIEVKINQETPWKVRRAIEMIENNVDLKYILEKSQL